MQSANPAHKWVLCLDDDIHLHPSTLDDLVAAAEAEPFIFMVTGALNSILLLSCCYSYPHQSFEHRAKGEFLGFCRLSL